MTMYPNNQLLPIKQKNSPNEEEFFIYTLSHLSSECLLDLAPFYSVK